MRDAKSLIAAAYDRVAENYALYADDVVYRHLASPLAAHLRRVDGRVLDVAAGTGALSKGIQRAVAVDISTGQLRHNPVEMRVVADAEALPFADDSFAAAGSAFGINHFPRPHVAVREMARVAPAVGLLTWDHDADPYAPSETVLGVVRRHAGRARTEAGDLIEEMEGATGSTVALERLLRDAGLRPEVDEVTVEVPWPGTEAFVDYRMSTTGVLEDIADLAAARAEAVRAVAALRRSELPWRPRLILGMGRR